jgi:hypothetical protein
MKPKVPLDTRFDRRSICAIAVITLLGLWTFSHTIFGDQLFIGNFDRLNTFLNTLLFQTDGYNAGVAGAWDNSMFMGRNTYALLYTFPNPLNWAVSLADRTAAFHVAGLISVGLLVGSGWAAYLFLRDMGADRFSGVVGAALYQFSALSVLRVTQNDMSFAVIALTPLAAFSIRQPLYSPLRFLLISACLWLMFVFCFLQEVAYICIFLGLYSIALTLRHKSLIPALITISGAVIAGLAASPRIYGLAKEWPELQRQVESGFDMTDFEPLYAFQNVKWYDVMRWFHDGLFGRFFGEMVRLGNNINVTEGMLIYTSPLVPLLIIIGLLRWGGRWFGLWQFKNLEVVFFYLITASALIVLSSKTGYRAMFELFMRVDFTHTRYVIVALLPVCALTALFLTHLRKSDQALGVSRIIAPLAFTAGFLVQYGLLKWTLLAPLPPSLLLTTEFTDFWRALGSVSSGLFGRMPSAAVAEGVVLTHMHPPSLAMILLSILAVVGLFALGRVVRSPGRGTWLAFAIGGMMIGGALQHSHLQLKGEHLDTDEPFQAFNSYFPAGDSFEVPSEKTLDEVHSVLEPRLYRTAFTKNKDALPPYVAPHLAYFWRLRTVEGYSSGIPYRLANLPWPAGSVGLRTLSFHHLPLEAMPWPLLALLNVKTTVQPNLAFYTNSNPTSTAEHLDFAQNPLPVLPRYFFADQGNGVEDYRAAVAAVEQSLAGENSPLLYQRSVFVERMDEMPALDGTGEIAGAFFGDSVRFTFPVSTLHRMLVFNELYHPAWSAEVGDQDEPIQILAANAVMQAVLIPPGASSLHLDFKPPTNWKTLAIALLAGLGLGTLVHLQLRRVSGRPQPTTA